MMQFSLKRSRLAIVLTFLALTTCAEPTQEPAPPRPLASLVDQTLWTQVPPEIDPFALPGPTPPCLPEAIQLGELFGGEPALSVASEQCGFVSFSQPLLEPVRAGDPINLRLWHFDLIAPEPSEAVLGLALGDEIQWNTTIPIPSSSGLIATTFTATTAAPAGTPIIFHLHNHGQNSYHLLEISVGDWGL